MHNSPLLLLPRNPDDPDDAQDRIPDDDPSIIPEIPPGKLPEADGGDNDVDGDKKEYRAGNCNDCNRQFCLDYNLPICKGAGMEDVFTTCFRELDCLLLSARDELRDGDGRDGEVKGGCWSGYG